MRWRAILCALALGLASCASYAPSSPPSESPQPSLPSGPVTLSPEEYFAVEAEILKGKEALRIADEQLQRDKKLLGTLWIFSGTLAAALVLDSASHVIQACK